MTSALYFRAQVSIDNADGERLTDHALAECQQIHVDVLHSVTRRPLVLDHGRADTRDLVRGDRGPDARAAKEDAAVHVAARDGVREGTHDQGVVVVGPGLRSEGNDRVT